MTTFTKELSVCGLVVDLEKSTEKAVPAPKLRTFEFNELDQFDQSQQKLHWKLNIVFESAFSVSDEKLGADKQKIVIETDGAHELTVKFIENCLVINGDKSKETDKRELLQDSIAMYNLGSWLITEKFLPFFLKFKGE